jgi:transposase-like protein
VLEAMQESDRSFGVITRVARQLDVGSESLRGWVRQAQVDGGKRPGITTAEAARIKELERENQELRRANEISQVRRSFLRGGARPPPDAMIEYIRHAQGYLRGRADLLRTSGRPVHLLRGQDPAPSARSVRDDELKAKIGKVFVDNYSCYGLHKMWHQLRRDGVVVAGCTVARLMRELGLRGLVRGKVKRTTPRHVRTLATHRAIQIGGRALAVTDSPAQSACRRGSVHSAVDNLAPGRDGSPSGSGAGDLHVTHARSGRVCGPSSGLVRGFADAGPAHLSA